MPGYRKYHSPEEKEEFADQLAADAKQMQEMLRNF